ncbi:MAG: type 4a pilus biogenesis protein PilO [Tepidisphaeraceae bacterium]
MQALQAQAESGARVQWVLGISLVVMVVGFYAFMFRPSSQRLDDLAMQIDAKRRDLNSNRSRVRILPDVMLAVTEMQARLDRFDKKLPKLPDLSTFMNDVTAASHQASLRNMAMNPGVPVRNNGFAEWPIALKFEGDFNSVYSFLRRAEEMQRLTRVKGLKVQGANAAKPGQVQVELSMNIYFSEG